jgi:hypothetical protein
MSKQESVYMEEAGLIFAKNPLGYFEPIAYDVKEDSDGQMSRTEIVKGDIFFDFLIYIKQSITKFNTITKKNEVGFIELYQWWIAFRLIKNAIELKSEDVSVIIARQAKFIWSV